MKTVGRVILCVILLVLTGLMVALASFAPGFVFSFYTDFSRSCIEKIAAVTGALPFALWEVLAATVILSALCLLILGRRFLRWLTGLAVTASILIFAFVGLWGLNHFAPGIETHLGLQVQPAAVSQLQEAASYFAQQAAALPVERDADGRLANSMDIWLQEAGQGYEKLGEKYTFFDVPTLPVKTMLSSPIMSHLGFTGAFIPITAESTVNTQTYPASLPFTMCHELAHGMAAAKEQDANFCAFLGCIYHPDPDFQYSGWYSALIYTYNALYATDRQAALEVMDALPAAIRTELQLAQAHYRPYEGTAQDTAQKINDTYLKAFKEKDGVESYSRAADLLTAWYLLQDN